MDQPILDNEWAYIVEHMPIPSVDLVIQDEKEEMFLLGKRTSKVAQGTWFVPGGRIKKGERYQEAVERILEEETGLKGQIVNCLGSYEHFYETADAESADKKHYTPTAFLIMVDRNQPLASDEQHAELIWFEEPPENSHEYTLDYLRDSGIISEN